MAKNILVVVDMQTAEAQKAAAEMAGEVKSLGEALSDQSEEVHKFRSGIDDAVEQLNIFGDAGAALVGEINKITDPMKRLALANDLASRKAGIFSSASQKLGDTLQAQRVKLIAAAGGVEKYEQSVGALKGVFGLALGGATAFFGFIGGAGVAAVSKFIEADRKTSTAVKEMTDGFDDLLYTFGNAVVGGDNLSKVIETVTGVLKDMTKGVDENRESIFSFSKDAIVGMTHVVEWAAKAGLGIYGFFQFIVDGLQELFRLGFEGAANGIEALAGLLDIELGDDFYSFKLTVETDTSAFKETERLAELLNNITSGAEKVRGFFGDGGPLSTPVSSAETRSRTPQTSGGAAAPPASGGAFGDIFSGIGDTIGGFGGRAVEQGQSDVARFQSIQDVSNRMKAAKAEFKAGNDAADQTIALQRQQEQIKLNEEQAGSFQFVASTVTSFAGSFVQASTQIAAAMAGQGGAWKAWQAAGLSAVSSLASTFGDFFLTWGAANFAVNPGLASVAIAGGLALKGLAGATAGAADRIGARDSKKATTAARAAEPVSSGRNQGDDRPIVLEMDGNRLAHTVSPYLSRAARNGILTLRPTT